MTEDYCNVINKDTEFWALSAGGIDGNSLVVDLKVVAGNGHYLFPKLDEMTISEKALFTNWFFQLPRRQTGKSTNILVK